MDSIQIKTKTVRLPVVRDGVETGVIAFDPTDILFAEKFYKALGEIETASNNLDKRIVELETDKDGNPVNTEDGLKLLHEAGAAIRAIIDSVFGAGTSQMAYGDSVNPEVLIQLLEGIRPYFQNARADKINPYLNPPPTPPVQKPAKGARAKKRKR